ncbi:MAG: cytidylate kinase-like family protein [Candidatus Latescibacterota bacterium]
MKRPLTMEESMAVMTISRLSGSGGDIIASQVAEGLGYGLVDSSIIIRVAEEAGVSIEHAKSLDGRSTSKTIEWLKSLIGPNTEKFLREAGKHMDEASRLNQDGYFVYAKNLILELAKKGNVVIVGRGGQFILKDWENAFHVRIIADMQSRIYWIREHYKISEAEALDRIKKSDIVRRNFIERNFGVSWDDQLPYHGIINTSKMGVDLASTVLIEAVKKFSTIREYIPGVKDRRSGVDRRKEERRKGERRSGSSIWTMRDIEKAVLREGRPMRSMSRIDRRKDDRRKAIRRKDDMPSLPEKNS